MTCEHQGLTCFNKLQADEKPGVQTIIMSYISSGKIKKFNLH